MWIMTRSNTKESMDLRNQYLRYWRKHPDISFFDWKKKIGINNTEIVITLNI